MLGQSFADENSVALLFVFWTFVVLFIACGFVIPAFAMKEIASVKSEKPKSKTYLLHFVLWPIAGVVWACFYSKNQKFKQISQIASLAFLFSFGGIIHQGLQATHRISQECQSPEMRAHPICEQIRGIANQ